MKRKGNREISIFFPSFFLQKAEHGWSEGKKAPFYR
jgi:hypothetical protein